MDKKYITIIIVLFAAGIVGLLLYKKFGKKHIVKKVKDGNSSGGNSGGGIDKPIKGKITAEQYFKTIAPIAKRVGKKYGVPWQAMVAHTSIESNYGNSSLTQKYYNFGGQKALEGEPSVSMKTHEYVKDPKKYPDRLTFKKRDGTQGKEDYYEDGKKYKIWIMDDFRKYDSLEEGLEGYAKFFQRARYKDATTLYPNDPEKFMQYILDHGYATALHYMPIIRQRLDKMEKMGIT